MAVRVMALRRDDACSVCGGHLAAGTRAEWDSTAKAVTCLACVTSRTQTQPITDPPVLLPIDVGIPGISAQRQFERQHARHEQQMEARWGTGRIGRIAKLLSDDPQSTTAWAKGANGERRTAEVLHDHLGQTAVLLHDRKVRGTRGNIDHLAVAASGVWIIDAKEYDGLVESRDVGGFFRSDFRLYVRGRDRTKLVKGLGWQLDAVADVLGDSEVPVHRALAFVGAEWRGFRGKAFQIDGVWITRPSTLAPLISAEGTLTEDRIEQTARLLAQELAANQA